MHISEILSKYKSTYNSESYTCSSNTAHPLTYGTLEKQNSGRLSF